MNLQFNPHCGRSGNHDLLLDEAFVDKFPQRLKSRPGDIKPKLSWGSIRYLQDKSTTLEFLNGRRLKVFGSPWTAQYGTWAFQYPPIRDVFSGKIPPDVDILITHGPPKHHLDVYRDSKGCPHLLKEIWRVHKSLKLVVFGHIHDGHGIEDLPFDRVQECYEGLLLGSRGILSLISLLVLVVLDRTVALLRGPPKAASGKHSVRLVNAAIAKGPGNIYAREPTVAEI